MLMAKQKKPQWKIEQSYLSKPTGKQIFEKQRLQTEFYEDDKKDMQGDEEVFFMII